MKDKKALERFYLEAAIQRSGCGAKITREGDDQGQEPDFFVELNGEEVGVELTELFTDTTGNGSREREARQLHANFLNRLTTAYYAKGGVPIRVNIVTRNEFSGSIRGKDREDNLIRLLVEKLEKESAGLAGWQRCERHLPDLLTAYVCKLPSSCRNYWRWSIANDHTGFSRPIIQVDPVSGAQVTAMLDAVVASKYKKVSDYKRAVNKVFLLVYADRTWKSGMVHLDSLPNVKPGGFDAIFLYLHPEQVYTLCPCRGSSCSE